MTGINRVKTTFTGFPGGPGVATMYATDCTTFLTSLTALWTAVSGAMPTDVNIQIENTGDIIDETTGELIGAWTGPAQAMLSGLSGGTYAAPAGCCLDWITSTYADGRLVRGRTFVVPVESSSYQSDGSIGTVTLAALVAACAAFVTAEGAFFVVWHRPYAGRPAAPPKPARPAHLGSAPLVTSSRVPDRVAVLRSRRA